MRHSDKYVDLLTDAGFKAVFGDPANKIIVKDFLNRMLQGERVIDDFEYMNVEQIADLPTIGKSVRYDLCCRDAAGAQFIIEMQRCSHDGDFFERSVFYGSLLYSRQMKRGEDSYVAPPTYVIGIMEGHLLHEDAGNGFISRYSMMNSSHSCFAPKTIILIFAQLGFFDKTEEECVDALDQWLYSFKHSPAWAEQHENEEIGRLRLASEIAAFDEKKRLFYDQEIMTERDYKHDLYWSRREGLEEGLAKAKEEKLRIAGNLLQMGLTVEQIAQVTGMCVEEVEALK